MTEKSAESLSERERLVKLLAEAPLGQHFGGAEYKLGSYLYDADLYDYRRALGVVADYLLSHGVSVQGEPRTEAMRELASGDGVYYVPQERAFMPGSSGPWPAVIKHGKHGRLVKRVWVGEQRPLSEPELWAWLEARKEEAKAREEWDCAADWRSAQFRLEQRMRAVGEPPLSERPNLFTPAKQFTDRKQEPPDVAVPLAR